MPRPDADPASRSPAPRPAAPPSDAPARLERMSALMHRTLQRTLLLAGLSAAAAVVLWWLVAGQHAAAGRVAWLLALVPLPVLLVPAAGTWLAVDTVRGVLSLPDVVRGMLAEGRTQAAVVRTGAGKARAVGFVRLLWALRGLATDVRGKAVAAVALFRLSRLPLLLAAVAAFVLNFAVIAAAVVALLVAIL